MEQFTCERHTINSAIRTLNSVNKKCGTNLLALMTTFSHDHINGTFIGSRKAQLKRCSLVQNTNHKVRTLLLCHKKSGIQVFKFRPICNHCVHWLQINIFYT